MTPPFDTRTVLLVEDNEDDIFIFNRAYKTARLPHPVRIISDGRAAVDYLLGQAALDNGAPASLPVVVFLDLKLPYCSGLEVLQAIRKEPSLAGTCVIVLTSSAEIRDIQRARDLGAQAFLVKPPDAKTLEAAIASVRWWMDARRVRRFRR